MNKTNIYKMSLHEIRILEDFYVMRVPGGWIYSSTKGGIFGVFVPWNEEYMDECAKQD